MDRERWKGKEGDGQREVEGGGGGVDRERCGASRALVHGYSSVIIGDDILLESFRLSNNTRKSNMSSFTLLHHILLVCIQAERKARHVVILHGQGKACTHSQVIKLQVVVAPFLPDVIRAFTFEWVQIFRVIIPVDPRCTVG